MSTYIDNLEWRYATKKFDASKKVSDEDLETLLKSIQLTASSYGLQPYHVLVITDPAIRKQLQPVSWGQSQIVDASYLLVFANKTAIDSEWIDSYVRNISETRGVSLEELAGYREIMRSKILSLSIEQQANWSSKQAYIALGNLLSAAAELKIDATPMEGFEATSYNEILGLTEKGLNAAVIAAVGHRSTEDATQHFAKVRQPREQLFTHL